MTDAFHPDLRSLARWLPRAPVSRRSLGTVRLLTALTGLRPADGVETTSIAGVPVRIHRPPRSDQPVPALVWIHGGGYVMGSAAQDDAVCRHFANALGIVVVSPDYRLAPEHPYPGPLDDCYAVLDWLSGQPSVDRARIAVGGASAGGGLAAGLALLARQREVPLAFQLLVYPMLDDRTALRTDIDERNFRLWNNKANWFGWQSYTGLAPGSDVSSPAAPARAEDLAGLAPAWIGVGTLDLFHDENLAYAERLRAAGVPCQLKVVPGAFHGFDLVRPTAGVSKAFIASQTAALGAALERPVR